MADANKKNFLSTIIKESATSFSGEVVDVITFAEDTWGLNFDLLPAQKFILKTYYKMELDDKDQYIPVNDIFNEKELYRFTEKEFLDYLIQEGRTNIRDYQPGEKSFTELIMCLGRRSSKSVITSIICNYELYKLLKKINPQEYYGFPEGQEICITCVATDNIQAGTLFDMIRSRSLNCQYLNNNIVGDSLTNMSLQTENDIKLYDKNGKATIKILTGGCSASGLRGKNNILVALDEAAFFIDNDGRFSGEAVYNALTPSVASFTKAGETSGGDGKVIILSSPFKKAGLFYDSYVNAWNDQDTTLLFKMYTSMVNPTVDSSFLRKQYKKSKITFMCEFGAEFSDNTSSFIDEPEVFDKCVDKSRTTNPVKGESGIEYFMGIDLGLKNDGTAIAVVHKEESVIVLDKLDVFFSGDSDVWQFKDSIYRNCTEMAGYNTIPLQKVADKIKEICKWFPIKEGTFDQWAAGFALQEMLGTEMEMIKMKAYSGGMMTEMWNIFKSLYNEQMVRVFNHPVLIPEILLLECDRSTRNIKVQAPQKEGYHDDASFAFAIATYLCHMSTGANIYTKKSIGGGSNNASNFSNLRTYYAKKQRSHGIIEARNVSNSLTRNSLWR